MSAVPPSVVDVTAPSPAALPTVRFALVVASAPRPPPLLYTQPNPSTFVCASMPARLTATTVPLTLVTVR